MPVGGEGAVSGNRMDVGMVVDQLTEGLDAGDHRTPHTPHSVRRALLDLKRHRRTTQLADPTSRRTLSVYFFIKSKSASTVASTPVLMEGSGETLKKGEWWDGTFGPPAVSASMSALGVPPTEK